MQYYEDPTIKGRVDALAEINSDIFRDDYNFESVRQLVQDDREGKIVRIPCRLGETVYRIFADKKYGGHFQAVTVAGIHITDGGIGRGYKKQRNYIVLRVAGGYVARVSPDEFGKTIFLTPQEAADAIRKMGLDF